MWWICAYRAWECPKYMGMLACAIKDVIHPPIALTGSPHFACSTGQVRLPRVGSVQHCPPLWAHSKISCRARLPRPQAARSWSINFGGDLVAYERGYAEPFVQTPFPLPLTLKDFNGSSLFPAALAPLPLLRLYALLFRSLFSLVLPTPTKPISFAVNAFRPFVGIK